MSTTKRIDITGISPDNRYLKLLEPGFYEGLEIPGGHYNFMQDFKKK